MKNQSLYINGRKVLGVRNSSIDELDSLLYGLSSLYTPLCEDEILSSCMARMHSRLEEISPSCSGDEDIGEIVTVFLAEGVTEGAGRASV